MYVKLIYAEVTGINDGCLKYIPIILLSSNYPKRRKLSHSKKDSDIAILECPLMHECSAVLCNLYNAIVGWLKMDMAWILCS